MTSTNSPNDNPSNYYCSSNNSESECPQSNASTTSGLDSYSDEYRHLIDTTPKPIKLEFCIESQPKNNLFDVVEKRIELKFHDRIEQLLSRNALLETDLETANRRIERLIPVRNNESVQLERTNHEFRSLSLLRDELSQCKRERGDLERANESIRCDLNDANIELSTKTSCIVELKEKIAEQYIELQNNVRMNSKYCRSISELENELEQVRKSAHWYEKQLHQCQNVKRNLLDEIVDYKRELADRTGKIEQLNLELSRSMLKCDEIELKALRDKNDLLLKLEQIDRGLRSNVSSKFDDNQIKSSYDATIISDLSSEVVRIKKHLDEQQSSFGKITRENAELLTKYLLLQKDLERTQSTLDECETSKKNLEIKLGSMQCEANMEVESLTKVVTNLKVELLASNHDKESIESSVKSIRDQFKLFKLNYANIKNELHAKNKQILQLEHDKQELFMNNSWNICELEKLKDKDFLIKELEVKITSLNDKNVELSKELKLLQNQIEQSDVIIEKNQFQIDINESMMSKYKDTIFTNEQNINDLRLFLSKKEEAIVDLKENLAVVQNEMSKSGQNFQKELMSMEKQYKQAFVELNSSSSKNNNVKLEEMLITKTDFAKFIANNFINLIKSNDDNQINVSEQIDKICKCLNYNQDSDDGFIADEMMKNVNLKALLKIIKENPSPLLVVCNKENDYTDTSIELKRKLIDRIKTLEDRCAILKNRNDEAFQLLHDVSGQKKLIGNADNSQFLVEIQRLKILLEVKELERQELRKKYERNNGTLLRKVREHIKGRSMAEKRNNHLQELYNNLFDEHNSLKLAKYSISQIENLQTVVNYEHTITKLKVENELKQQQINKDEKNENEDSLKLIDNNNIIDDKKENISLINNTVNNTDDLIKDQNNLISKLTEFEAALLREQETVVHLHNELEHVKRNCSDHHIGKVQSDERVRWIEERNNYLNNELEIVNSVLHGKCEELKEFHVQRTQSENNWLMKEENMEMLVRTLKTQLLRVQNAMNLNENEKFVLQRLCNDLKVALKTHVKHNKVLKERLLSKDKTEFNSLPNIVPLSSLPLVLSKVDDSYVNELLKQCNAEPLQDKPLEDLQICLNGLKNDVLMLQKQIIEKNVCF